MIIALNLQDAVAYTNSNGAVKEVGRLESFKRSSTAIELKLWRLSVYNYKVHLVNSRCLHKTYLKIEAIDHV
jgi:hypothetical protein